MKDDFRHFTYEDLMENRRTWRDYLPWVTRLILALLVFGAAFWLLSALFGGDETSEADLAEAETTTDNTVTTVAAEEPGVETLPNGRPIDQPGANVRPERESFDFVPADPSKAFVDENGTFYSTLNASEEALGWMDSMANMFNHRLPPETPLAKNSSQIAGYIDEIINGERLYSYGSGFEESGNAPYMLFVDSDEENFTEVVFAPETCGDDTWWDWRSPEFAPFMNGAYDDPTRYGIPIPADFEMAALDSDFHVMVYDYRADIMFELWKAQTTNLTGRPGIEACWGGVLKDFTEQNGVFPFPTGVDAAGLTAAGLTITLEDVRRGRIEHAIGISTEIVVNNPDSNDHSYPANRNDGLCSDDPDVDDRFVEVTESVDGAENCLYEGQFLRLPVDYDTSRIEHPLARMVAEAARDYGLVVHDIAGCFCLQSESSYSLTASGLVEEDPWLAVYDDTDEIDILNQIDWSRLEVLPKDWDQPSGHKIPCALPPNRQPAESPNLADDRCQLLGDPYRSWR